MLADVRDESAEDIRLVLEPRARTVDAAMLMETLFRHSDLEVRVPLNMNVLIDGRTPKVCSLPEVLRAFLDHRREVLLRRTAHRLEKIAHRLEVLGGYIIAYLNLDRVIEIIRGEDEPKPALMAEDWGGGGVHLTDVQAEAILNMRLRWLRRLEEMELRAERDRLLAEQGELRACRPTRRCNGTASRTRSARSATASARRAACAASASTEQIDDAKAQHQPYPPGARRTGLADAPQVAAMPVEATIEREPDHRRLLGAGLDPRAARPPAARRRAEIQGRRRAPLRLPRRDHRQAARVRHQRPLLHARRPTSCPAGAAWASRCG